MIATDTILALSKVTDTALVQSPEWYRQLVHAVNDLLVHDFQALVQLLYRLDVDEHKIRSSLAGNPGTDAAELIAQLLFARQMQKLKTRQRESAQRPDDDEEKW
jgi:hypothetical protein